MDALYLNDCYLKEFEATVVDVTDDRFVILDKTAFYPMLADSRTISAFWSGMEANIL